MVAAGLQRTDPGQVVHRIVAVGPGEGIAAAAAAGQAEAGLRGRIEELPKKRDLVSNRIPAFLSHRSRACETNISAKSLRRVSRTLLIGRGAVGSWAVWRRAIRCLLLLLSV